MGAFGPCPRDPKELPPEFLHHPSIHPPPPPLLGGSIDPPPPPMKAHRPLDNNRSVHMHCASATPPPPAALCDVWFDVFAPLLVANPPGSCLWGLSSLTQVTAHPSTKGKGPLSPILGRLPPWSGAALC